jgi:hypothetical protein
VCYGAVISDTLLKCRCNRRSGSRYSHPTHFGVGTTWCRCSNPGRGQVLGSARSLAHSPSRARVSSRAIMAGSGSLFFSLWPPSLYVGPVLSCPVHCSSAPHDAPESRIEQEAIPQPLFRSILVRSAFQSMTAIDRTCPLAPTIPPQLGTKQRHVRLYRVGSAGFVAVSACVVCMEVALQE